MSEHVNGWSVIARHLLLREKNQSDLARLLNISPAAITQIKNGQFQLNSRQLLTIITNLEFSVAAQNELYSEIFSARMHNFRGRRLPSLEKASCEVKMRRQPVMRKLPVGRPEMLRDYIKAFESIGDFLRRKSRERYTFPSQRDGFALQVERGDEISGVPERTLIIVDGGTYPIAGDQVLAAWSDHTLTLGEYRPEESFIRIVPNGQPAVRRKRDLLRWIHPVMQCESIPVSQEE